MRTFFKKKFDEEYPETCKNVFSVNIPALETIGISKTPGISIYWAAWSGNKLPTTPIQFKSVISIQTKSCFFQFNSAKF